jgi:hypothetical protein
MHLNWESLDASTPFVCEIPWLRPLWSQLQREYQLRHETDPIVAITLLECIDFPPRVTPKWQLSTGAIELEDYTVKLGTLMLTEQAQQSRYDRWERWLQIIQDQRETDTAECINDDPLRRPALFRVLKPLVRLRIPSIYKVAFWETIMQTGMTSERRQDNWPCPCHSGPSSPGRAHFFYQCPLTRSLYSHLFQVDSQLVPDIIRNIWMVHPWEVYPLDAWALICLASTHSVDMVRKKIYKAQLKSRAKPLQYYQQWSLNLCVSILTGFVHVLEVGHPSMSSLHPLQWCCEEQKWKVSSLVSPFSPNDSADMIDF